MPSTSGTVSQTVINVNDILEDAMKACGLSTGEMSPENWVTARNNLYFYLSALTNDGLQLWTLQKYIIGMYTAQSIYPLDIGAVDIMNAVYRTVGTPSSGVATATSGVAANAFDGDVTTFCTQTATNGSITYDFGIGVTYAPIMFGILPNGNNTYNLIYEHSPDNVTWTAQYAPGSQSYTNNQWNLTDVDAPVSDRFWRVRETGGAILNLTEVMFGSNPTDISIARMSNDVYANLTNKFQQGQQPLQYWVDRRQTVPYLNVWPVPNNPLVQIVVYRRRQIQDVGSLTNTLEIPQRWITCVTYALADLLIMKLDFPPEKRQEIFMRKPILQQAAMSEYIRASNEERDSSQVNILDGVLSGYTGGYQ